MCNVYLGLKSWIFGPICGIGGADGLGCNTQSNLGIAPVKALVKLPDGHLVNKTLAEIGCFWAFFGGEKLGKSRVKLRRNGVKVSKDGVKMGKS
ncbi:hypothetical protein STSP2_00212 [Anaerohalosphaera lusitana]|uniref:Uncharacterized protein n=1 Tax=Anaerohalosphaera lusitana TaxID=1936003 RepID=A0A1U9NGK7_9BACT|nr:hypothetical protein STSP2_00212 [Anaerohalosphaera lusitana]